MTGEEKKAWDDVVRKLDAKQRLEKMMKDENWQVFHNAWRDISNAAKHNLTVIDPKDTLGIMKLQMLVDFYESVIPKTISEYRLLGEEAYQTAKSNGWLGQVGTWLKEHF